MSVTGKITGINKEIEILNNNNNNKKPQLYNKRGGTMHPLSSDFQNEPPYHGVYFDINV